MRQQVINYIRKHHLIHSGETVVVALSGGADSLALTHLLKSLEPDLGIHVRAAHYNHQLRGPDADRDADFVCKWAAEAEIPLDCGTANVRMIAEKEGLGLEETARNLRYEFLHRIKNQVGASKIAVAHHRGDQAETILLNLIRGTGLDGLSGIRPSRTDGIIRPFLEISRQEIEAYCTAQGLQYREDGTNRDTDYTRNRIRWELLPELKEVYNSNVEVQLSRLAEMMASESDYMNGEADIQFFKLFHEMPSGYWVLLSDLLELHPAIRPRVLRRVVMALRGNTKDLSWKSIQRILDMIQVGSTGKQYRFKNLIFMTEYQRLTVLADSETHEEAWGSVSVQSVPGSQVTPWGTFLFERLDQIPSDLDLKNNPTNVVHLDAETIQGPLCIRTRKSGDRFWPIGSNGQKKLKDYLIDKKVPQHQRDKLPLICDFEKIIWIPGYQPEHRVRITGKTTAVLRITMESRCSHCRNVLE